MAEIIFDEFIAVRPTTWKRARSVGTRRFTDEHMQQAKSTLGWEVRALAPKLKCNATDRFGFNATYHIGRSRGGDGDRYENLLMDALEGIVWENDEQVDEWHGKKLHNAGTPGIRLTIWRIT